MDLLLVVVLGLLSVFAVIALVFGLRGNSTVDTEGWHRRLRVLRETAQPDAEPVADEELVADHTDSNVRLLPPAARDAGPPARRPAASPAASPASSPAGSTEEVADRPVTADKKPQATKRPAADRRTSAQKRETTKKRAAAERSRPQGRCPAKSSSVDEENTPPS